MGYKGLVLRLVFTYFQRYRAKTKITRETLQNKIISANFAA